MFQKTSKTLYYMKIMGCKIPLGENQNPFLAIGLEDNLLFFYISVFRKTFAEFGK